ncbi:MAG: M23 family metallopeptidase, partial [Acidobacteria bacterium]|nr:M23 family metallopeptidase [Acidobacteriota bacterium]
KKCLTFVIAGSDDAKIHKFRIPQYIVLAGSIFSILFLLVSFVASLYYSYLNYRTRDYDRVQTENLQLRDENRQFKVLTGQLEDKLVSLEVVSQKLKKMSGMDHEPDIGIGVGGRAFGLPSFLRTTDRLAYLGNRVGDLDTEFMQLNDFYQRRNTLLAATPSIMPVRGYTSGGFGFRLDPFSNSRDFHPGVDISSAHGNKVIATADGVVTFAGPRFGYGKTVIIDHRFGMTTLFAHLSRITVRPGQKIQRGEVLGYVGSTGRSTGPHLHYEVRLNDRPLNPMKFLSARRG